MSMRKLFPKILLAWGLFWGLMLALLAVYFGLWAVADALMSSPIAVVVVLTVLYVIGLGALMIWFWKYLNDANQPPDYRYAETHGIPTPAKILSIQRTRWHHKQKQVGWFAVKPVHWEYELRIQVQPTTGTPPYEADAAQFLHPYHTPKKGEVIEVRVHPEKPEVVYLPNQPIPYQRDIYAAIQQKYLGVGFMKGREFLLPPAEAITFAQTMGDGGIILLGVTTWKRVHLQDGQTGFQEELAEAFTVPESKLEGKKAPERAAKAVIEYLHTIANRVEFVSLGTNVITYIPRRDG